MGDSSAGTITYLGPSDDGRTNRWRFAPGCGHKPFEPKTTMFKTQHVACPKCDAEYWLHFETATVQPA